MRHFILISLLFISSIATAQKNSIFNDYKFDSSYILLSLSPTTESGLLYPQFCFIIKDLAELEKLKSKWILTKKGESIFDTSPISLYLIKDKSLEKLWTISPKYESIMDCGNYYSFSMQSLKELANKFPLHYIQHIDTVSNKAEYLLFSKKCKLDTKCIFLLEPSFDYEGQFTIQVKKDQKINSPKVAIETLKTKYNKLVSKDSYNISYALSEKNLNDQSQMTFTVESTKVLYDNIINDQFIKSNWLPSVIEVESYWTK